MLVERLVEKGVPIPTLPADQTPVSAEQVVVTLGNREE